MLSQSRLWEGLDLRFSDWPSYHVQTRDSSWETLATLHPRLPIPPYQSGIKWSLCAAQRPFHLVTWSRSINLPFSCSPHYMRGQEVPITIWMSKLLNNGQHIQMLTWFFHLFWSLTETALKCFHIFMYVEQKQINCSNSCSFIHTCYILIFNDDISFGRGYLMKEDKWTKFDAF